MGLDITVHKAAVFASDADVPKESDGSIDYDAAWELGLVKVYGYDNFPLSMKGLEGVEWMRSTGDTYGFRAGSYSGYGSFRTWLTHLALRVDPRSVWENPNIYHDLPFFELINFSDAEGVISGVAAADLLNDFQNFHWKAKEESPDPYYIELYETWMTACADAAFGGMIEFH